MDVPGPHDSLVPTLEESRRTARHSERLRWAVMIVLALLLLAALANLLGLRTTTASATAGDLEVEVLHASIARAGLTAPLQISVHRPGGIDGPVEISLSSDYLDRFDQHGLDPQPDSSRADERVTTWAWDHVEGPTLVMTLDARIEPGVHWRFDGIVEATAGSDEARVEIVTWIAP